MTQVVVFNKKFNIPRCLLCAQINCLGILSSFYKSQKLQGNKKLKKVVKTGRWRGPIQNDEEERWFNNSPLSPPALVSAQITEAFSVGRSTLSVEPRPETSVCTDQHLGSTDTHAHHSCIIFKLKCKVFNTAAAVVRMYRKSHLHIYLCNSSLHNLALKNSENQFHCSCFFNMELALQLK